MAESRLLQLARDLEWLGCELEYVGHKHAAEGFPETGPTWDSFREKQRGVLVTADKIERVLKNTVQFDPSHFVGVEYPVDVALDCITNLLEAVEVIKRAAAFSVHEIPPLVRSFTKMVKGYVEAGSSVGN